MSNVLVSITQQPTGALIAAGLLSKRERSWATTKHEPFPTFDIGSEGQWVIKTSTSDIGQQAIRQLTFVASNQLPAPSVAGVPGPEATSARSRRAWSRPVAGSDQSSCHSGIGRR